MDLKSFLPKTKHEEQPEHYWSVIIEPKSVQAGVWRVVDKQAEVVSRSPISPWEEVDELINSADTVLTSAVSELDDSIDPEKTVFGVMASWVEDGQIVKEHLGEIKRVCTELSLKPAGFVVLAEAISNYIKAEEGSPLSGVVMGVSKDSLELSVFKLGNLLGTTKVARSISVVEDVAEGLTRFADPKGVPSRFLLYDGKEGELEEVKQDLIKANWDDFEKIKFLHTPNIEIITAEQKIDAVSLAGAVDIAQVTSLVGSTVSKKSDTESNVEEVSPEELGFALGEDITTAMGDENLPKPEKPPAKPEPEMVINRPMDSPEIVDHEPVQDFDDSSDDVIQSPTQKESLGNRLSGLTAKLPSFAFLKRKKKPSNGDITTGKKALIIGGIFIVLLFVGAFAMWWYYPKATVTLYLSTNQLEERIDVTIDPDAGSANFSDATLPGKVLTTTVSGDKTTETTGITTVGDRATGSVTLYRVGTEVSLPSDTVLVDSDGLEFTLDSSVTVASGSASTPGTTDADVTAAVIGSEYNLASQTTFQVDGYSLSDIEAKNNDAFSGGSSREISAVSEDDQERLRNELEEELQERALRELEGERIPNDCSNCVLIAESVQVTDSDESFDKKVGDEADSLKLSLEQEIQVLAVSREELTAFARELLNDRIPEGYVLRDDQIEVNFEFDEEDDGKFVLNAVVKANLFSEVDPEQVAEQIAGKYPEVAETFLVNEIPGFSRAQINLRPRLRGKLGTLPHVSGNIEIEIAADR